GFDRQRKPKLRNPSAGFSCLRDEQTRRKRISISHQRILVRSLSCCKISCKERPMGCEIKRLGHKILALTNDPMACYRYVRDSSPIKIRRPEYRKLDAGRHKE